MSIFRQRDSLDWLSLFSVSEKEKKQKLQWIQQFQMEYDSQHFAYELLQVTGLNPRDFRTDDVATQIACEYVALKFMIEDSEFAEDLLSAEDFKKAQSVFARKQLNSKILRHLLSCFFKLLRDHSREGNLKNLFTLSILEQIKIAQEDEINRSFGALKKVLDKVSSGVKNKCYFEADRYVNEYDTALDDALNTFVVNHFGYNFNEANNKILGLNGGSWLLEERGLLANDHILGDALLRDVNFWSAHPHFCVIRFINEIAKHNSIRHAEKVLQHMFENLKRMPHMSIVFENKFALYMSKYEELVNGLEAQGRRFTFKRLTQYCDISVLDNLCFCYPMNNVDEKRFEIGRKIWDNFICEYNYPHDAETVMQFLSDEVARFIPESITDTKEIAVILDCGPFHFTNKEDDDRKLFRAYHPDCFTAENIWKRVYLKAHAVTLLSDDEATQFSYLQRIFIDLIKAIEERLGICTAHQLDMSARIRHYERLKEKLKEFGIKTNDQYKEDYVVSLLDRDTAQMSEAERFPELEQLGDSIYGLAVAELLFYNPTTVLPWNTEKKMQQLFEDYTRAEAQVLISKKHGFDELFLHIGLPAKYLEFDSLFFDYDTATEERLQGLNQEKYLADSLEMIIGSVCRDKGFDTAIQFAKELLQKTFSKTFTAEIHPTDENKRNTDIEWDYWARILPAPRTVMESEHHVLWNALHKVVMTLSLGTDNKEKRNYISHSFGNTAIYGDPDSYDISWVFYDYLQSGLDTVLKKYGDKVRESYKNKIR
ncbi:MAG: hypothetical protein IKJ35_03930 [Clostridia bacterium]|nr:hypothetical protein [Clostridia bacterium]